MRRLDIRAGQPFEGDARGGRLLAFLAHGLAFARGKRREEAAEILIAAIVPVILRIGALQQSRLPQRLPLLRQGERHMPGGRPLLFRGFDGGGGEVRARLAFREAGPHEKARAGHGREGYSGLELGIISPARLLIGLCPGVIEDVFALGMGFEIAGQDRRHRAVRVLQGEMARRPARLRRRRAAFLKRKKESVRQKWIERPAGVGAGVPVSRRDIAHTREYADA